MLEVGDKFTVCMFCLKSLSLWQAEAEKKAGMACTKEGHIMAIAMVTHVPKKGKRGKQNDLS